MTKLKSVLIMAGGTGGHIFPGLAVAKKMREQGTVVQWLGTQKGLEARVVPEAGFPIHFISISGLRGKGIKDLFLAPFRLCLAVWQAIKIIRQINPDVVLGMGGFASGPGGIASWLLRKPLVIHEQNAKAGMTNRCLANVAKKVLEGFPCTFKRKIGNNKIITVGNPVRAELSCFSAPEQRNRDHTQPLRLLVLGGSLGAQAINDLLPQALAQLSIANRPSVLHQTGEKNIQQTTAAYQAVNLTVELVPFIQEMDKAYKSADLVLCRAGALTVAELCAVGLGAVFVPFPYAVDDHQTTNANFMVEQGAAILVQQKELTVKKLVNLLEDFVINREKCLQMAKAAYALRRVDATEKVVMLCENILLN